MKPIKLLLAAMLLPAAMAMGQTSCSDYNTTLNLPQAVMQDTTGHDTGNHHVSTGQYGVSSPSGVTGTCTYTSGGSTNCNTTCQVSSTIFSQGDTGTLSSNLVSHAVGVAWSSGSGGAANGGVSCSGTLGGGAASCLLGNCSVNVSFQGGVLTVTSNGTVIWQNTSQIPMNCNAEPDPTTQTANNPPPDPCLGGSGGTTDLTNGGDPYGGPAPDCSPIIVDVAGKGFHLTSAPGGVMFDIAGTGHPVQIAWTAAGVDNAFLALPGPDGLVHNGKQLFGNFTPQPQSPHPNGFLALADYDTPENGGNGDGVIDEKDSVYFRLRLWIDENHDGVSQAAELHTLPELGVYSIALSYFESRRTDDYGNRFRYKAVVNPGDHRDPRDQTASGDPARWTYDVFFVGK